MAANNLRHEIKYEFSGSSQKNTKIIPQIFLCRQLIALIERHILHHPFFTSISSSLQLFTLIKMNTSIPPTTSNKCRPRRNITPQHPSLMSHQFHLQNKIVRHSKPNFPVKTCTFTSHDPRSCTYSFFVTSNSGVTFGRAKYRKLAIPLL